MLWVYLIGGMAVLLGAGTAIAAQRRSSLLRGRMRAGSPTIEHGRLVTLVGTIRQQIELVQSPLSGRRGVVVYAECELPEMTTSGERVKMRTTIMVPFEIETRHGVVVVDARTADLLSPPVATKKQSPELAATFVASHGRGKEVAKVGEFREVVLAPGDHVAVHGLAQAEDLVNEERGYRDNVRTRTRVIPPAYPLIIGPPQSSWR